MFHPAPHHRVNPGGGQGGGEEEGGRDDDSPSTSTSGKTRGGGREAVRRRAGVSLIHPSPQHRVNVGGGQGGSEEEGGRDDDSPSTSTSGKTRGKAGRQPLIVPGNNLAPPPLPSLHHPTHRHSSHIPALGGLRRRGMRGGWGRMCASTSDSPPALEHYSADCVTPGADQQVFIH